ncbi:cytochrome P450 [Nocardioides sp. NPDC006303]|uniref:cytochrome P450 n=1 Tax=Nocardioides sp. NPDC006303 TaxID=3156747 RepID=UPI0033B7E332
MLTADHPRSAAPILTDDPFGREVLTDPLPFHERLREAGRVAYLPQYDLFAMGRYDDVHASLTDWQTFQSAAGVGMSNFRKEKPWRPPSLLLEADPPHHDAPRAVLEEILSPRRLRHLHAQWLADAEVLVDEILDRGELDGAHDIADVFPLRVFPDAVGLRQDGRENLLPYGDHTFNSFGPPNALVQKGQDHLGMTSAWIAAQCGREALAATGFGADIWAAADRGDITHEMAPLIVRSLLTAGVDTTVHGLSAVIHAFVEHPDQWDRLRAQPGLARVAFDEAVRLESPVQTFFRTTTRDLDIDGVVIPDSQKVLLVLAAANRDPRHWVDPDRFDLSRDPSGHVGFGMGIHQCVGQHVARLEAEAVLTAMARRIRRVDAVGPAVRHQNNTLRGWKSIPIQVVPV